MPFSTVGPPVNDIHTVNLEAEDIHHRFLSHPTVGHLSKRLEYSKNLEVKLSFHGL